MEVEQIARFVRERVSYKPGWELRVDAVGPSYHPFLSVRADLEDSYDPGRQTRIGIRQAIPPVRSEEQLLRWVRDALGRIELHERDEWLKLDGEMPFDPHRDDGRSL